MTMEKTKDDGQRSAYSDYLKRRDSTMRELLRMADKPIGDPQPGQTQVRTDEDPIPRRCAKWNNLTAPEGVWVLLTSEGSRP